jgi:two-component system phosphate regulon response regulator PhoB
MNRILIVDDNADVLQVMQLLLSSRGYEVDVTTKGEEAYKRAEDFDPNLIFLDIHLGGIDGRDICKTLKQNEETSHIPVILFSANNIKDNLFTEAQADAFIAKPFDIHDLILKVDKLIGAAGSSQSASA